jgi:hypothetical protein
LQLCMDFAIGSFRHKRLRERGEHQLFLIFNALIFHPQLCKTIGFFINIIPFDIMIYDLIYSWLNKKNTNWEKPNCAKCEKKTLSFEMVIYFKLN